MDVYNRGYQAGISDGGDDDRDGLGESGRVGFASIINPQSVGRDADTYDAWQDAGFYAIAYHVGDGVDGIERGTTVISYRGTNAPVDYLKGWLIGAGVTAPITQADETVEFYSAVVDSLPSNTNVILTGHSLGGGLAGLASVLSGTEGYGFDHMPFGIAASVMAASSGGSDIDLDFTKFSAM